MASPLPAGGGSGEEEMAAGGRPDSESDGVTLAERFERAARLLPTLLAAASKEQLLYLYARYKQMDVA